MEIVGGCGGGTTRLVACAALAKEFARVAAAIALCECRVTAARFEGIVCESHATFRAVSATGRNREANDKERENKAPIADVKNC